MRRMFLMHFSSTSSYHCFFIKDIKQQFRVSLLRRTTTNKEEDRRRSMKMTKKFFKKFLWSFLERTTNIYTG
jgi:hypothetical protein